MVLLAAEPTIPQLNAVVVMLRALRLDSFGCPVMGPVTQPILNCVASGPATRARDQAVRVLLGIALGPLKTYLLPRLSL